MFRFKSTARSHHIDHATIRETIAYIRDDVAADPNLSEVAGALEKAILALDAATHSKCRSTTSFKPVDARFFSSRS